MIQGKALVVQQSQMVVDLTFTLPGALGRHEQSCCLPGSGGCLGSACTLLILRCCHCCSTSVLCFMVTEPLSKKRSLHMSQDIYLIYTTVWRIYGDFCDLCKNKEKLGVHWSNDLLCFSWCTYPEFYQLSLGSLSSLRLQYLSAVTFLKGFAISVQNLWITSGGWVSQINWAKSIAGFCLGGFLVCFSAGKHGRVSSQLFERQIPVVFWINLYLNLYRHFFIGLKISGVT